MSIFKNRLNLIPVAALLCSVAGAVLIACHILIPGIVVAAVGLVFGIVTRAIEKKCALYEALAYWAFVLSIVLFIISGIGFAGYTVWDYVNSRDIG